MWNFYSVYFLFGVDIEFCEFFCSILLFMMYIEFYIYFLFLWEFLNPYQVQLTFELFYQSSFDLLHFEFYVLCNIKNILKFLTWCKIDSICIILFF
jgi:hypothetical protein